MFDLLTQILLWLLIGVIAWYLLKQFIQPAFYTTLGFLVMVGLLVVAFFKPDANIVSEAWSVLSLPLRPLGLALFFLIMMIGWKDVKFDAKTFQNQQLWVLIILFVSSMPATAYWCGQQLESEVVKELEATAGQSAPVMVLLAQGTTLPQVPPRTQIEFTDSGDRVRYAAELFLRTGSQIMIVTGANRPDLEANRQESLRETNEVSAVLQGLGVPGSSLIVDDKSNSIQSSAAAVERILTNPDQGLTGVRSLYVVSSALNIQRVKATFEQTLSKIGDKGVTVIPRATDFYSVQEEGEPRHKYRIPQDLIPDEHALARTSDIIQEYFGRIYYFLRGWLSSPI